MSLFQCSVEEKRERFLCLLKIFAQIELTGSISRNVDCDSAKQSISHFLSPQCIARVCEWFVFCFNGSSTTITTTVCAIIYIVQCQFGYRMVGPKNQDSCAKEIIVFCEYNADCRIACGFQTWWRRACVVDVICPFNPLPPPWLR